HHGIRMKTSLGIYWVYGRVDCMIADTQEQYKNVSVKSPEGRKSSMPCVKCLSTRDDFHSLTRGVDRSYTVLMHTLTTIDNEQNADKAREDLGKIGHTMEAIRNPVFHYVCGNSFRTQTRDKLHMCLWEVRIPVIKIYNSAHLLSSVNRDILERRISCIHYSGPLIFVFPGAYLSWDLTAMV
ncbi:MAG: hypothetical protein R6X11_00105, partial [Desulfonatronovibrio sp.]